MPLADCQETDTAFLRGVLHHFVCGVLLELEYYFKDYDASIPRPFSIGPSLLEGSCGKMKREMNEQGNTRVRDSCLRAKLCCNERHLSILEEPSGKVSRIVKDMCGKHIETVQTRKERLGKLKLAVMKAKEEAAQKAKERRTRREASFPEFPGGLTAQPLAEGITN